MKNLIASLILGLSSLASFSQTQLFNGSVAIPASNAARFPFYVPEQGARVTGHFRAEGGTQNDIQVYIMTPVEYVNFINGNDFNHFFSSGARTIGNFDVNLSNDSYLLVFSNKTGWVARTVYGTASVSPKAAQPKAPVSRLCTLTNAARIPLWQYEDGDVAVYAKRGTRARRFFGPKSTTKTSHGTLVSVSVGNRPYWAPSKNVRC